MDRSTIFYLIPDHIFVGLISRDIFLSQEKAVIGAYEKRGYGVFSQKSTVLKTLLQDDVHNSESQSRISAGPDPDVSKADQGQTLVDEAMKTYGRLDCAFNNAGVEQVISTLHDCTENEWNRVININLKGVWLCMKYEIPVMLTQGAGAIVNTSSVGGLTGGVLNSVYSAAKHGVIGLTKSAALEYSASGIRVNAVCPGMTRTPFVNTLTGGDAEIESAIIGMHPISRMAEPSEIAEAVVWLCSDEASFVTGHALSVDGGWVAQ